MRPRIRPIAFEYRAHELDYFDDSVRHIQDSAQKRSERGDDSVDHSDYHSVQHFDDFADQVKHGFQKLVEFYDGVPQRCKECLYLLP